MKNVVTPETARKLKEAGFKQPEPEAGQAWYTKSEMLLVVVRVKGKEVSVGWPWCEDPFSHLKKHVFETCIFAPTATDILKEKGIRDKDIAFRNYIEFDANDNTFEANDSVFRFYHENPAEAEAKAWLKDSAK